MGTGSRHLRAVAASAAATMLLLSGCTGERGQEPGESTAPPPSAADRLTQSRAALVEAGSIHLELTSADLPGDLSSVVESATGDGTLDPSAFKGTFRARMGGVSADVPVVARDGKLWVKLPYVPKYVETDPADLGVPDPATIFDSERGVVGMLAETEEPAFGRRSRIGADVVQEITGKLPGRNVRDLFLIGDENARFDVVYSLVEETWQLREVRITGAFFPPATSSYSLSLSAHGEPVTIDAP